MSCGNPLPSHSSKVQHTTSSELQNVLQNDYGAYIRFVVTIIARNRAMCVRFRVLAALRAPSGIRCVDYLKWAVKTVAYVS